MPSPFPCSPVIRDCSWRKTQIEKKYFRIYIYMPKIKRFHSFLLEIFQNSVIWLAGSIFDPIRLNIFKSLFISLQCIQHAKNHPIDSVARAIWLSENSLLITQEPQFRQIWDLCRHKANMNFHLKPNPKEMYYVIFWKI